VAFSLKLCADVFELFSGVEVMLYLYTYSTPRGIFKYFAQLHFTQMQQMRKPLNLPNSAGKGLSLPLAIEKSFNISQYERQT
jgi:hypothetical protein